MPVYSTNVAETLNSQCILLPPPLVTSANSNDASVFSIFLLMDQYLSLEEMASLSAFCRRSA